MNKPRKHAELIHKWAEGAEIQYWNEYLSSWQDHVDHPAWLTSRKYRIKPREFESEAYYTVLDAMGGREVAWYNLGRFYVVGDTAGYTYEQLSYVGEKLDIAWPEE